MKKPITNLDVARPKQLSLGTETLRILAHGDLLGVTGGRAVPSFASQCPQHC